MVQIIECVGLWGSGKTTVMENLIKYFNENDIRVLSYYDCQKYASQQVKLLRWWRYISNPFILYFIYYALRFHFKSKKNESTISYNFKKWFEPVKIIGDIKYCADFNPEVEFIVCDEALWNNLAIYASNYNLSFEELKKCYTFIQYPTAPLFIIFDIEPSEAARRTGLRAYYDNDKKSDTERLMLAESFYRYISVAQKYIYKNYNSFVVVHGDDSRGKIVEKILTKIST